MARIFGLSHENNFHWILYSTYKNALLASLFVAIITITKLWSQSEYMMEDKVLYELKFLTIGASGLIFLLVIPYYYIKTVKVIGFSRIDFFETFPRKAPRPDWGRQKIINKVVIVACLFLPTTPLGWLIISMILNHYNSIQSYASVVFAILIWCLFGSAFCAFVSILFLMVYQQYKNHFIEIPSKV